MYPNLKLQIFRLGIHQNQLASQLRIDETVLSKIIHGHREPSVEQRKAIALYLQAEEDWLFERYDNATAGRSTSEALPPEGRQDGNS